MHITKHHIKRIHKNLTPDNIQGYLQGDGKYTQATVQRRRQDKGLKKQKKIFHVGLIQQPQ